MIERFVKASGLDLWTESFGDPGAPPILLIMGASAQGIRWPEELIERLVGGGRFVIRYDHRDTGQSSSVDFQQTPYTLADLADDAIGVLDAYGLAAAHLVGASMGGMIAQLAAISHPERVLTLTAMMSSPLRAQSAQALAQALAGQAPADALPPPAPALLAVFQDGVLCPPTTREASIEYHVRLGRALAGDAARFDEDASRQREQRVYDRARDPAAAMNHGLVPAPTQAQADALAHIHIPALVIHGTEDPMFPPAHGAAIASAIPGATLVMLEGMGHDLPVTAHEAIARSILAHTDTRS